MNTPLLVTSAILLASVAARPVDNGRQSEDLRELVQTPSSDERQAVLGHVPNVENLNSFRLHDIPDTVNSESDVPDSSKSPKLAGTELSHPDPGLASPYIGPQRHLAFNQELPLVSNSGSSPPSPTKKIRQQLTVPGTSDYSPVVVTLVLSSLAALVLLGMTVAVVSILTIFRQMVLNKDVWHSISQRQDKGVIFSEKPTITRPMSKQIQAIGGDNEVAIAASEMSTPIAVLSVSEKSVNEEKNQVADDPDFMPLPEPPASSLVPTMTEQKPERNLGRVLVAWSYDNWVAHFMVALFGWVGLLFGGARNQ